ncbi:MAG: hypothetical protein ACX93N_07595 [Pseudohaliea sp.]
MNRTAAGFAALVTIGALAFLPARATNVDLLGLDVEGVRLGMSTSEAGAALDNRGYDQIKGTSFQKKDARGVHYVGLKLNPGGEVISVEVAHFLYEGIDPDAHRDTWVENWGEPDNRMGNAGHDWNLTYENEVAVLDKWAKTVPRSELRTRLVSKNEVIASRRGREVSSELCMAIKDKPVSLLNVTDRENLMECIRTGQLRIVAR